MYEAAVRHLEHESFYGVTFLRLTAGIRCLQVCFPMLVWKLSNPKSAVGDVDGATERHASVWHAPLSNILYIGQVEWCYRPHETIELRIQLLRLTTTDALPSNFLFAASFTGRSKKGGVAMFHVASFRRYVSGSKPWNILTDHAWSDYSRSRSFCNLENISFLPLTKTLQVATNACCCLLSGCSSTDKSAIPTWRKGTRYISPLEGSLMRETYIFRFL